MADAPATAAARHRVVADAPSREGTCFHCDPSLRGSGPGAEAGPVPDVSLMGALRSRERGNAGSAKSASAAATSSRLPCPRPPCPSTSPASLLAAARFSSLRLAATLDAAAAPPTPSADNNGHHQPPPFFARRRSRIVEAASATVVAAPSDGAAAAPPSLGFCGRGSSSSAATTTMLLLALTAAGGCAAFCRRSGELLAHLNASGDDVVRSIFLNRARGEVVAVSVGRGDAFASLRCRAVPLAAVAACRGAAAPAAAAALLSAASRPLFEGEELRWPGFVEFDDVNGVVLTRSAGSCGAGSAGGGGGGGGNNGDRVAASGPPPPPPSPTYAVHDLSDYSTRFRVDGSGVREVRTAPGLLLLVMEPRAAASASAPPVPAAAPGTWTPSTTTRSMTTPSTVSAGGGGGGGVPCRLLSIADGTLLASFDAPAPPGGGGRLDFIELFGHTLLVGGGTPPTLTRVDVRRACSSFLTSSASASSSSSAPALAAASPPAPFPTPSAFIFLHEARLFLAFGGGEQQQQQGRAAAAAANGAPSSHLLTCSSVVVCDGAGARIRSLDGAVSVGSAHSPGGPAANSVYVTADQQFIFSYSSRAAAVAATAVTATAVTAAATMATAAAVGDSPSHAASRRGSVAASRGRCSCGAVVSSPGGGSSSASPSPATSSGGQQQQQQQLLRRRRRRSTSTLTSSDEEGGEESEEEEEEIGGVITVSHVLSGRCVARLAAKKLQARKTKMSSSSSKRAKIANDDDSDGDGNFAASCKANDAVRRALSDVSALFYDEETGELVTGSTDGHVHVWSNHG